MTERFWDDAAPYGANGYQHYRGEWVEGTVAQSVQFKMRAGDDVIARGAMRMTDGRVYTWTVRRPGRYPEGSRLRLATRSRLSFKEVARGMFEFERDRIEPELIDGPGGYRSQVEGL